MVYKSGQIFLQFCQNSRVWQTDRQTDDRILIARPRLHSMQHEKKPYYSHNTQYFIRSKTGVSYFTAVKYAVHKCSVMYYAENNLPFMCSHVLEFIEAKNLPRCLSPVYFSLLEALQHSIVSSENSRCWSSEACAVTLLDPISQNEIKGTPARPDQLVQDAQLSQRHRAAGCIIVFAKSRRLELVDYILRTL